MCMCMCIKVFNPNREVKYAVCVFNDCSTIMLPYFSLKFLPPFYAQAQAPKSSAQPVNKNNAIAHKRTHIHAKTTYCFCTSLSNTISFSLCFFSASPTRNRNAEHDTRALHECTAWVVRNYVELVLTYISNKNNYFYLYITPINL